MKKETPAACGHPAAWRHFILVRQWIITNVTITTYLTQGLTVFLDHELFPQLCQLPLLTSHQHLRALTEELTNNTELASGTPKVGVCSGSLPHGSTVC
jgi:hypothetical protein